MDRRVLPQHAHEPEWLKNRPWHGEEARAVLAGLGTDPAVGLRDEEAATRLQAAGPNRLPEARRAGPLRRFLAQFRNLLILVLIAAAVVTALLGHVIDTMVILAVVFVNAIIGFVQEGNAEAALDAIRSMLTAQAKVLRGGRRLTITGDDVVPGDVVLLEPGDKVAADLRIVEARGGLRIQEAVLTGESIPVEKGEAPVQEAAALGDRSSMAFSGTIVAAGTAKGVAVATGGRTELGKISRMLSEVRSVETPLLRQMDIFARWLTVFVLGVGAAILLFGLTMGGYPFETLFMAVVGLAVAAIPEGMPAILTVTLAIGVEGMAKRHAIVRRLPAIETLGSVSVICSDKTGTLTKNEMTVSTVALNGDLIDVGGAGYTPRGGFSRAGVSVPPEELPLLRQLALAAIACNDADLVERDGGFSVIGDPMEGALLSFGRKAELHLEKDVPPRRDAVPFDAAHRFMATLHQDEQGGLLFVKGAPERVLEMCADERTADGAPRPLDRGHWESRAEEIAARGQRVLALATKRLPRGDALSKRSEAEEGLALLGLVGLIDPPREEAIEAVAECQRAGIAVKMITGDHAGTAGAIARQIGLERTERVLRGADIESMDDEALGSAVADVDVFARTSPEHKLRLVAAMQAQGAIVAMTGDGVNDAPALKRADIGVAMGLKGTEAAKEASEIVLADDNFATIAAAVKAGRTVYDNLMKAVVFLLPVNGGESMSLIIALLFGLVLPITPVQILWVNMVSSVLLAMTLAFEPPEPGVMRRPPRPAGQPILSRFVLWRVAFVSTLFTAGIFGTFAIAREQGADIATARSVAVNTLVVMEIFYLFSVRYLRGTSMTLRGAAGTKPVLLAVGAVVILQLLFTYAPFMGTFFDSRPLGLAQGALAVAAGVGVLAALEVEKGIRTTGDMRRAEAPA